MSTDVSMQQVSDGLAGAVETAGRSVVRVSARRRMSASGIAWSEDGLVVTAHHVVHDDDNIEIGLPDGTSVAGELVGRDMTTDLALIRTGASLDVPQWVESSALAVGHIAMATARPGRTVQATLGVVSGLGGPWQTAPGGNVERYLATDVLMYPGFSGGALVDASGNVIGLNTSALRRGASMALPVETLVRVVGELAEHGRVRRGYLGVGLQPARLPAAIAGEVDRETGLLIVSVEPDGPAESSGIGLGDVLLSVDGSPVKDADDLMAALPGSAIGREVTVRLLRGGQIQELSVKVGARPAG